MAEMLSSGGADRGMSLERSPSELDGAAVGVWRERKDILEFEINVVMIILSTKS